MANKEITLKSLESGCYEFPYYWESTANGYKNFGLNKNVDLQNYDLDGRKNAPCYKGKDEDRAMINIEICDHYERNNPEDLGGDYRYEIQLWWLGDHVQYYPLGKKSVIKSMFFKAVKFLIKKLNKPNLTPEDVDQAYDDCAEMLDQRHTIEERRAKLESHNRDFRKRFRNTFGSSFMGDLRKNQRKWTDKEILDIIEKEKTKLDKKG